MSTDAGDGGTAEPEAGPAMRLRYRPATWAAAAFALSVTGLLVLDFEDSDTAWNLYVIGNLLLVVIGTTVVSRQRGARKGVATGCLMVAAAIVAPVFLLIALIAWFMPT